jgi:hypothetical protein
MAVLCLLMRLAVEEIHITHRIAAGEVRWEDREEHPTKARNLRRHHGIPCRRYLEE